MTTTVPSLLDVPVMADDWRDARKQAIELARTIDVYRGRRIVRTHTERSIVWGPDFQTWSVTIEFAEDASHGTKNL